MLTSAGHLTYCTNIHVGESWSAHFEALKHNFPLIKQDLSPAEPMGIGLRLSNRASKELADQEKLAEFKTWLSKEDAYIFTMNGFPYGEFHNTIVKDQVHSPDWRTSERLSYTLRLTGILSELLPKDLDGGISTSPLSYRHWFSDKEEKEKVIVSATENILQIAEQMHKVKIATSKVLHLDIEPEPDGLLETGTEFIDWYKDYLLPMGKRYFQKKLKLSSDESESLLKEHIRLCYDICHFALGYEDHSAIIKQLGIEKIKIGKFQISAALKALLPSQMEAQEPIKTAFSVYNEPTYLHQVIARKEDGTLLRYLDLPTALSDKNNDNVKEWRAHFHVPIFENEFGKLESTQSDILDVLSIHEDLNLTQHLEVETYTWNVLPAELKLPSHESIARELRWVLPLLDKGF